MLTYVKYAPLSRTSQALKSHILSTLSQYDNRLPVWVAYFFIGVISVISVIGKSHTYNSYTSYTTYNNPTKKRVPRRTLLKYFKEHPLPNNHALLFGHKHSTIGYAKCLVEILDVAQCSIHAVLAERVNVGLCEACSLLVADVLSPDCSV